MKKFVFTLQRLYEVKKLSESQLLLEQGQINKRLADLKKGKELLKEKFAQQRIAYDADCKKGMLVPTMQSYGDYFEYLIKEIKRQDVLILECMQEMEVITKKLLKIMNEIKVLDKIKQEQLNEYNKELQKNDDKMLEDFISGKGH